MPSPVHTESKRDQELGTHLAVLRRGESGLGGLPKPPSGILLPHAHNTIAVEHAECHPGQTVHQVLTAISRVIRRLLIFLLSPARNVTVRNGS